MNSTIMAARKSSSSSPTATESRRSLAAIQAASRNHPINPVPPTSLDSSSVSDSPLWAFTALLSMTCDPTSPMSSARLEETLLYLEKEIKQHESPASVELMYKAKMVLYKHLGDRFLLLAAANQGNCEIANAFLMLASDADAKFEECYTLSKKWLKQVRDDEIEALAHQSRIRSQQPAYRVFADDRKK